MSWNVAHCSFLPPNKTPPNPHSRHLSHPISSQHPPPQPTVATTPTQQAMLITHYLSDPSQMEVCLGDGWQMKWRWCVCMCDQVLGVCDGNLMLWALGIIIPIIKSMDMILSTLVTFPIHHCHREYNPVWNTAHALMACVTMVACLLGCRLLRWNRRDKSTLGQVLISKWLARGKS